MFSSFMTNTWISATAVAIVAGIVGFFVVLRRSAFQAHAIPQGAFAGAAAANLLSIDPLVGLVVFSLGSALGIASLSRTGRHDVVTALALVLTLALGALFLSQSTQYESQVYALLFGQILGVSSSEIWPVILLACACAVTMTALFRPLILSSVLPEVAKAKGIPKLLIDTTFLIVLGLATAITVPIVGALLIFTLMIGPPAAARTLTNHALSGVVLAISLCLATLWAAIALSYLTNWPIGFFVGTLGTLSFGLGQTWRKLIQNRQPFKELPS